MPGRRFCDEGEKHYRWTALGKHKTQGETPKGSLIIVSLFRCECGREEWLNDAKVRHGKNRMCWNCSLENPKSVKGGRDKISSRLTRRQRERKAYVDRLWPDK